MTTSVDDVLGDDPSAKTGSAITVVAGAVLVLLALSWVLDLHIRLGLTVYDEQPLALAAGLSMLIGADILSRSAGSVLRWPLLLLGVVLCAIMVVIAVRYPTLTVTAMMRPSWLVISSSVLLAGLLFLVWRTIGLTLALIVVAFAAAALFGEAIGIPSMGFDFLSIYLLMDPNSLLSLRCTSRCRSSCPTCCSESCCAIPAAASS